MSSAIPQGPDGSVVVELTLQGAPALPLDAEASDGPRIRYDPDSERSPRSRVRYRSGLILTLAYTCGPLAPALMRQGQNNLAWMSATGLAGLAWAAMLWRWADIRPALERGTLALVPWMLGVFVAACVWMLGWCRGVKLAGRDARFVPERLPSWLRAPRLVVALGLVLPGIGHLLSDHPRRAAVVLWNAIFPILPLLALWHSAWLWRCNRNAGAAAVPGTALEVVFLAAAGLAAVGLLAWIAGSLDGARLVARRGGRHDAMHGDAVALALLATLVLALVGLRPLRLAQDLDRFAGVLQQEGYRVAPLCMEMVAMRLDRAEPRYVMASAELLESFGKHEMALSLRETLRRRWESYAEHLLRQEVQVERMLLPPLIGPSGDLVPWPQAPPDSAASLDPVEDSSSMPRTTSHDSL